MKKSILFVAVTVISVLFAGEAFGEAIGIEINAGGGWAGNSCQSEPNWHGGTFVFPFWGCAPR